MAIHCIEGMNEQDRVEEDLLQIPLNDSWHLGADVENSDEVVL